MVYRPRLALLYEHTLLMMTAESTLSKRPVMRIIVALLFLRSKNYTSSFYGMSFVVEPPIYNRKSLKFCFLLLYDLQYSDSWRDCTAIALSSIRNRSTRDRGVIGKRELFLQQPPLQSIWFHIHQASLLKP